MKPAVNTDKAPLTIEYLREKAAQVSQFGQKIKEIEEQREDLLAEVQKELWRLPNYALVLQAFDIPYFNSASVSLEGMDNLKFTLNCYNQTSQAWVKRGVYFNEFFDYEVRSREREIAKKDLRIKELEQKVKDLETASSLLPMKGPTIKAGNYPGRTSSGYQSEPFDCKEKTCGSSECESCGPSRR
jgi:hypothetical protein